MRIAILTTLALIAFAANSILCRLALDGETIDPATFTSIRLLSGALALLLILGLRRQSIEGNWGSALALTFYALPFSFAYVTLAAGTGALILFASVQITMIAAGLVAGERLASHQWVGIAIAFGGLVWLVSPGLRAPSPAGSALMAIAGIAWGFYSLRGRGSGQAIAATGGNFLRTAPFAILLVIAFLPTIHITPRGIALAVISGAIASALGYVIWYSALPHLSATGAATVQLSVPLLAAAGGVVLLSEPLTPRLIVAAGLILGGLALEKAEGNSR
ncbi:MAG TPA: DMT family transporter [Thermoanaerobaculia bacterium]|nr:DMT family transporter [Thermoanaerobaculia bacterium]